jgi:hypothetical protein
MLFRQGWAGLPSFSQNKETTVFLDFYARTAGSCAIPGTHRRIGGAGLGVFHERRTTDVKGEKI